MSRRGEDRRHFVPGEGVRIVGNVGLRDDDDPGGSVDLKGETARVLGCANNTRIHPETGEQMIGCQLDNGLPIEVPVRALDKLKKD